MMKKKHFAVGIDIGATKIAGCIGSLDKHDKLRIIGAHSVNSKGLKSGIVTDIKELTDSIEALVRCLEEKAQFKIGSVYANITGDHIDTHTARGLLNIASRDNEITRLDVNRVIDIAKNSSVPLERHILHIFPLGFTIDEQMVIKSPLGMFGSKLAAELHIITGLSSCVKNITKSIRASGLEIEELVFSGFATANAVLNEHEKELGVILVDIGAQTTEIVVFLENNIRFAEVIPIGGDYITEAISKELKVSFEYAELVKKRFGCASLKRLRQEEKFIIKDGRWQKGITKRYLCEIIEPTLNEIISQIKSRIDKVPLLKRATFGVVFTGGCAAMEDFLEVSEDILGMPVRMGIAKEVTPLLQDLNGHKYLTSIGLVRYGLFKKHKKIQTVNMSVLEKVRFRWKELIEEYF